MDRNILIFIFILVILFIGHVFLNESFYNMVYNDVSGNNFLSVYSQLAQQSLQQSSMPMSSTSIRPSVSYNSELNYAQDQSNIMTDSCIDGIIDDQSADFMRYIPGKNPDDYIRKDSIPCYGCSVY